MKGMIGQTTALFVDAYRELNSKRLFWISLVISGLVVVGFAGVGVHNQNLSFFGLSTPIPAFGSPAVVYKLMFSNLGVGFWLTFLGMILALISTAGIFPDLITGGTIDLYLSKPIGRARLFLTKYLTGLLFAALQVTVFCVACWLVLGLRAGDWSLRLFIAVPLVVCVFSYLFCMQVLLGLMTRSTVAAILLTIVFWGMIFIIDKAEVILLTVKIASTQSVKEWDQSHPLSTTQPSLLAERSELESSAHKWSVVYRILYSTKTSLPKTRETNDLIDRALLTHDEIRELNRDRNDEQRQQMSQMSSDRRRPGVDPAAVKELTENLNSRTARWAVGTSLLFEAVIVAISAWLFARRDY